MMLTAARDLLAGARYLVMQFEIPLPVVRRAIALADELGVRVILNPAPAYAVEPDFLRGVYAPGGQRVRGRSAHGQSP